MRLLKIKKSESGYMLLESLVTLSVIVAIILLFFPLITDWLSLRNNEKNLVEQNRLLYETSMNWTRESIKQTAKARNIQYTIESNTNTIKVSSNNNQVGVTIYEIEFD